MINGTMQALSKSPHDFEDEWEIIDRVQVKVSI